MNDLSTLLGIALDTKVSTTKPHRAGPEIVPTSILDRPDECQKDLKTGLLLMKLGFFMWHNHQSETEQPSKLYTETKLPGVAYLFCRGVPRLFVL